jgi:ribonucleoside-triphosphate reductase
LFKSTKEKAKVRSLEDIEKELAAAREALTQVEGTPAEVYSRIVGYYRSVRNWNRGKREEYGERKLYRVAGQPVREPAAKNRIVPAGTPTVAVKTGTADSGAKGDSTESPRLLLFVRPACPACPGAKAAAGKLGIPVDLVNADTEDGLAEASRRQVFSTPTAILLSREGKELGRALDALTIAAFAKGTEEGLQQAASL